METSKLLLINLIALMGVLTACGKEQVADNQIQSLCEGGRPSLIDDARPNILVIGDSISIGYTAHLKESLDQFEVLHNPCNARNSANGVANIDSWLETRTNYDAIIFNHGLHDVASYSRVSPEQYEQNLYKIANKILDKTPNAFFVLTTFVPANEPYRENSDVLVYNQIAIDVMNDLGIPVIDLYTASTLIAEHRINPDLENDVHYTELGYSILANEIINSLP